MLRVLGALLLVCVWFVTGCALLSKSIDVNPKRDLYELDCKILAEKGKAGEAEAMCDLCLSIDPHSSDCLNALGTVVYPQDSQQGLDLFKKAIKENKRNYVAHNNAGVYYAMANNHTEAVVYFEKSHKINPEYFDGLFNHAYSLIKLGDLDRAKLLLGRARIVAGDRDLSPLISLENTISRRKELLR